MDAVVHDEAVQHDKSQATVTHSSPGVGGSSASQASELDDIARRASVGYPNNKPIVSSSGKSIRVARWRLANCAVSTAQGSDSRDRSRCGADRSRDLGPV
jgi:hypothetical protein